MTKPLLRYTNGKQIQVIFFIHANNIYEKRYVWYVVFFQVGNGKCVFIREKREDTTYVCDIVSQSLETFLHDPCDSKLLNIAVFKNNGRQFNELWLIMTTSRRRLFVYLMKEIISCCQCCIEWKDDELAIIVNVYVSTLSQASCLDLEDIHTRNLMVNFIPWVNCVRRELVSIDK